MSDFLQTMAEASAARAAAAREITASELDKAVLPLQLSGFGVIAELKDTSPAEGELANDTVSRSTRAAQYAAGGATAISVLTEPSRFSGSLAHLEEVVRAVPDTPVMRKDFLVAPVQILEARAAGASGVLLITAMLDDGALRSMLDCAFEHELFVLLEAFDSDDLERTRAMLTDTDRERAAMGKLLFGVNSRNLRTLAVDAGRLQTLAPSLPAGVCVAESGLLQAADAARVARLGYSLGLVGTALMRSDDPAQLIAAMRQAGSAAIAA